VLTDDLPTGVRFDSATPSQGSCAELAGRVTCDLGALPSGGSATVDLRVTPQQTGTLTNGAGITGNEGDPNSANDSDAEETAVSPAADLSITKSDAPDPVFVNQPLTYSLQVSNDGPSGATNVAVTDPLPAAVAFESAIPSQGTCSEAGNVVTCDVGSLSNGGSATIDVRVTPRQGGAILNTASVQGSEADPTAGNNSDSERTGVSLYDHPREATTLSVSLVPAHRQTIGSAQCSARGGAPSTHGAPLAHDSCNPPSYLPNTIAALGPQAVGVASFTVIPGDPATPTDEADLSLFSNVTDVVTRQGGGDYNPSASGTDVSLVSKFRLTDTHNGSSLADPATVVDFDFPVGMECLPTPEPAVGSSCSLNTTADAAVPGAVNEGDDTVIQLNRVRLGDSGLNGVRGDGDDRNFALQGVYVP
jgi:uncharacterized repeat protein (TIGR01451 family)